MLISEIFKSIDGESRRAGELATFVRSVGCNLRCKFCDSTYTWQKDDTCKEMSVEEIVNKCKELGCKNITFTGGEPLIQKDSDELIFALTKEGFDVSIETDGAIDFTERDWFKHPWMLDPNNVGFAWVCADYKCGASGMTDRMLPIEKFAKLRSSDVLKFVVGSKEDLELAHSVMSDLRALGCHCWFYLSPVFGMIQPVDIVNYMMNHNLQDKIKFQMQLHKLVWDPNMRGV